ncbi:unnamed protein product, partial [Staurois parvus]
CTTVLCYVWSVRACVCIHVCVHVSVRVCVYVKCTCLCVCVQVGRTDYLETRALPEGPGSVGGPMRCP